MTKATILHETLHIGCRCHRKGRKGVSKPEVSVQVKREFFPKKKYSKRQMAKTSIKHIGSRTDPLSWLSPLPEMKKVESKADSIVNMKFKRDGSGGGRIF